MSVEKNSSTERPHLASRAVLALAAIGALVVLPLYAIKVWRKTDYTDFEVYYRSAARIAQGGWDEVYTLADGASPFRYAPPTLPFFRPFAELPIEWAKMLWYFLQYAWFGAGFFLIYLTLKRVMRPRNQANVVVALSMLFILRFCLDCFTIGQVSSLLFLAFCASFYSWTSWRSGSASAWLTLPSLVKIGPAFLYPLFLHGRPRSRLRAILAPIATVLALTTFATIWIGPLERSRMLWIEWANIVAQDSTYYDASHYGSQSIKSGLLRLVKWGWVSPTVALELYLASALLVCGAVLSFWIWRTPRRPMGRAAFFALGLFPYLWVMPETFKYSLTILAIPVALLFADVIQNRQSGRGLSIFALAFGALTLSLAGKDLIGDYLFFGSQHASLPLIATFFLGAATARLAWRQSRDGWLAREIKGLFRGRRVSPWSREQEPPTLSVSLLAPLPLHSRVSIDSKAVLSFLQETRELFTRRSSDGFEILVQPYGDRLSELNPLWIRIRELAAQHPEIRLPDLKQVLMDPDGQLPTRNAALRESFLSSRGKRILTAQLEQPCDPSFYDRALSEMEAGFELVRGNRRLEETRFKIPVRLLPIVYQRHRLGLRFNRLVRRVLPVGTTDTHSGTLATSREFASKVFALQSSTDFLFDLELALIAKTHSIRQKDLPLTLFLAEEKSRSRMGIETLSILLGLPRLARRYRAGFYDPMRLTQKFTADDWGLTPEVNRGILDLARRGVLRRVSLMSRSSYLTHGLEDLKSLPGVELGLHFDLTFGKSSPGKVLLSWLKPGADRTGLGHQVRVEFQTQISKLRDLGVDVRYLDGHHHIHLVPGLMDAIAEPVRQAGITQVRVPYDSSLWLTPKAVLNLLALLAARRIRRQGFVSLPCFYPQHSHFFDPGLFRAGLARNPEAEVIVHPARSNDLTDLKIPDSYTEGRVIEYRALRMLEHLKGTPSS